MKRIIISFIVMIALMLNIAPLKAEQTPTVTFDGTSSLKYNTDVNEFSKVFEGMVPSETRTLNIQLDNQYSKDVNFYMSTEVLKAFEDAITKTNGAYKVSLILNQDNQKTVIYGGDDALIGTDENGLYDLNGALSDKYMIARVKANKQATVSMSVTLDGVTMKNEYQGLPSTLKFDFTAQYDEPQTNTVINKIVNTKYIDQVIEKVKTGDPTTITLLAVTLVLAGSAIAIFVRKGGKKHEK
ncbi:MAG: hypothetical protein RR630_01240 [Coprobacillus sp.]